MSDSQWELLRRMDAQNIVSTLTTGDLRVIEYIRYLAGQRVIGLL